MNVRRRSGLIPVSSPLCACLLFSVFGISGDTESTAKSLGPGPKPASSFKPCQGSGVSFPHESSEGMLSTHSRWRGRAGYPFLFIRFALPWRFCLSKESGTVDCGIALTVLGLRRGSQGPMVASLILLYCTLSLTHPFLRSHFPCSRV